MPFPPNSALNDLDKLGLATALTKARKGYQKGGVPIGAALVFHGTTRNVANAAVLGCAHNQRIQRSSPTLHAEIAALEDAGRQKVDVYKKSTMYTTLRCKSVFVVVYDLLYNLCTRSPILNSPCVVCTGAILFYKIPRVVIGENANLIGGEDLLKKWGVEVIVLDDPECKELMGRYIKEKPEDWDEDIGE